MLYSLDSISWCSNPFPVLSLVTMIQNIHKFDIKPLFFLFISCRYFLNNSFIKSFYLAFISLWDFSASCFFYISNSNKEPHGCLHFTQWVMWIISKFPLMKGLKEPSKSQTVAPSYASEPLTLGLPFQALCREIAFCLGHHFAKTIIYSCRKRRTI